MLRHRKLLKKSVSNLGKNLLTASEACLRYFVHIVPQAFAICEPVLLLNLLLQLFGLLWGLNLKFAPSTLYTTKKCLIRIQS